MNMKKIALTLSLCLLCVSAFAQGMIPSKMVSVTTNTWLTLPTTTNLQGVLDFVDTTLGSTVNYAPLSTTNLDVALITPRWKGDSLVIYGDNLQLWQSVGTSTSDWRCVYPVTGFSTNVLSTNAIPAFVGQILSIYNPQTNILWIATNTTGTANWHSILRSSP